MTVPEKKQMNVGVELLLERMKTHPEEFYVENQLRMGSTKWSNLWHMYQDYLSEEDKQAYIDGVKAINQQRFTEHILEGLVDPKPSNGGNDQYYQNLKNTALGGATQGGYTLTSNGNKPQWTAATSASINANSLTVGDQTLDQETIKHMKAHLEYLQKEKKQKKISMLERILGK